MAMHKSVYIGGASSIDTYGGGAGIWTYSFAGVGGAQIIERHRDVELTCYAMAGELYAIACKNDLSKEQ